MEKKIKEKLNGDSINLLWIDEAKMSARHELLVSIKEMALDSAYGEGLPLPWKVITLYDLQEIIKAVWD